MERTVSNGRELTDACCWLGWSSDPCLRSKMRWDCHSQQAFTCKLHSTKKIGWHSWIGPEAWTKSPPNEACRKAYADVSASVCMCQARRARPQTLFFCRLLQLAYHCTILPAVRSQCNICSLAGTPSRARSYCSLAWLGVATRLHILHWLQTAGSTVQWKANCKSLQGKVGWQQQLWRQDTNWVC